jgi:N-acetylglucosaminyl-diphospho-decaprenol L-rhamnosyltransferase
MENFIPPTLADVTCIIVTYNSAAVIAQCLRAIPKECPIVVIDNASKDTTVALIRAEFPAVQCIASPENLGYGRAANEGFRHTKTRYAFLLNPDVFLEAQTIPTLLAEAAGNPQTPIFAPLSVDSNGQPMLAAKPALFERGHRLFKPLLFKSKHKLYPNKQPEVTTPVGWVCGCAMFFNMAAIEKIGWFDEKIFLFYEETDICLRAVIAGSPPLFVPAAQVTHIGGGSSGSGYNPEQDWRKHWYFEWARFYMAQKYSQQIATVLPWYYLNYYRVKAGLYRLLGNKKQAVLYHGRFAGALAALRAQPAIVGITTPFPPFLQKI